MKKIAVFQLECNYDRIAYSMEKSDQTKLSKHFSIFADPSHYYYFIPENGSFEINDLDLSTDNTNTIAKFYYSNKTFLYGEMLSTGQCLYGILGSTMHRNFSSTDLMLIISDIDFNTLDIINKYPEYSHGKRGWDRAFVEKFNLADTEKLA